MRRFRLRFPSLGATMKMKVLAAALALSGCAGYEAVTTASGQNEVTLTNAEPACVRSALLTGLLDGGYMVRSSTDSQIVVGRPSLGNAAFLAPTEERRSTFLMIPMGTSVRVVMNEAFISNAGSGFESASPIYPVQGAQNALDAIGARVQAMCGR